MSSKIKICLVLNRFVVGGAETVALDMARSLDPRRFEVTVLAVMGSPSDEPTEMHRRFLAYGIRTVSLGLSSIKNPLAMWKLYRFFKTGRFDIVHGHNRFSDAWAVRFGHWAGVPHLFWTRHLVYTDMNGTQLRRYRELSEKTDLVLAVSETVRENCLTTEGIRAEKVETLTNGIDMNKYKPLSPARKAEIRAALGLAADSRMLLFVGRMAEQKAPEAFVELMRRLHASDPSLQGFMCGTGPLHSEIMDLAARHPDAVTVLGMRNDVPDLLAAADLFVSTSRVEGLPLNIMETMCCGTPFVGPRIGQIAGMLDEEMIEACLYTPPPITGPVGDKLIEAWKKHILGFLADEPRAAIFGTRGREIMGRDYSLAHHVQRQVAIYERFL